MGAARRRIGYARVSTEEQNLDLQRDALREAGCTLIFEDHGVSAVAPRPAFEKTLRELRAGDALVIWKMDRAFRSLRHALDVLEDLEGRGVCFASLTDAIETTTAMGRFVYQLRNALAELERQLIGERTRAGMKAAQLRGRHVGRPPALRPEQVYQAEFLMSEEGENADALARRFGVHRRTLERALARLRGGRQA